MFMDVREENMDLVIYISSSAFQRSYNWCIQPEVAVSLAFALSEL